MCINQLGSLVPFTLQIHYRDPTFSLSPLCVLLVIYDAVLKWDEETSTICQYFANRIFYSFHNISQGYPCCQIY